MTASVIDIDEGAVYAGVKGWFYRLEKSTDGLWLVMSSQSYRAKSTWICVCSKNPQYRALAEAFMRPLLVENYERNQFTTQYLNMPTKDTHDGENTSNDERRVRPRKDERFRRDQYGTI